MMRHALWIGIALAAGAGIAAAQSQPNTLTAAEKAGGWKLLFDGKSLARWEAHGGGSSDWKAEGGTLSCAPTAPSWLGTVDNYSNFVLRLEFKGAEKVNSGVFIRSQKEGQPASTGYEVQIWDYQPGGYNTGSLVNSIKADPVKIIPDQWNSYEISAQGDHYVIVLNGKKILDGSDSKHASGVIGLQCQPNNPISFRNLKLQAK